MKALRLPREDSHKGENGKLLIVAGSKRYHGSALLSLKAAIRFVDLVYFIPGEKDKYLIQSVKEIPEVIVVNEPPEVDAVLYGPGTHKAKPPKFLNKFEKVVIDGDGLGKVRPKKGMILTPHEGEFRRISGKEGSEENVKRFAKETGCTILKKGTPDVISDGKVVLRNNIHNAGMTKGGTGDVLAGLVAALYTTNDSITAAWWGARICGHAGNILYKKYGFFYSASDLVDRLPEASHSLLKRLAKKR